MNIYMAITNPDIGDGIVKSSQSTYPLTSISYSAVAVANSTIAPTLSPITVTVPAALGPSLLLSLLNRTLHNVQFDFVTTAEAGSTLFESIQLGGATITLFQETCSAGDKLPTLELTFAYRTITYKETGSDVVVMFNTGGGKAE